MNKRVCFFCLYLNESICTTTETPSRIKRKQKKNINPSAPRANNINGNREPKKCDPTSPIIIFAGLVFHHKNPKQAPATAEINSESSTVRKSSPIKFE